MCSEIFLKRPSRLSILRSDYCTVSGWMVRSLGGPFSGREAGCGAEELRFARDISSERTKISTDRPAENDNGAAIAKLLSAASALRISEKFQAEGGN